MEDQLEYAAPNLKLRDFVDLDQASFLATYSIELSPEITERLARALARAVELIVPAIRDLRMITLIFGKPPAYVIQVGTGTDIYYADMSQDPVATAANQRICLHAERIASLPAFPIDAAVVVLLEELVHVWMNVRDETIAKTTTAHLYGGLVVANDRYETYGQVVDHLTEDAGTDRPE
jgi:hypothetical protein